MFIIFINKNNLELKVVVQALFQQKVDSQLATIIIIHLYLFNFLEITICT